jgi:hypothetical protein
MVACTSSPTTPDDTSEDEVTTEDQVTTQSTAAVVTWTMNVTGNKAADESGTSPLVLAGQWREVAGSIGQAVEFKAAPSLGTARRVAADNPGSDDFAVGQTFRTTTIPNRYSGNMLQKGFYSDPAQIKLQLLADGGGTVGCLLKGSAADTMLASSVVVDDGNWHNAVCWRTGDMVGLTVDDITASTRLELGDVSNGKSLRVGNKSPSADWQDQLFGSIDCVVYAIGPGARASASAALPC